MDSQIADPDAYTQPTINQAVVADCPTAHFAADIPKSETLYAALTATDRIALPGDWWIAVSDVVQSRKAIASGQYKSVNMAGVAMISAVMNALETQAIPYVFGGDGAAVCIHPDDHAATEHALSQTVQWVDASLGLTLRAALVPMSVVVEAGHTVDVARVKISDAIDNYAFFGGGISFAEDAMKQGAHMISAAMQGDDPDLTGLSCRWTPISESGRQVISLIVEPATDDRTSAEAIEDVVRFAERIENNAHPVPKRGPGFTWPPKGINLEVAAQLKGRSRAAIKAKVLAETALAWFLDKTGIPIGPFSPKRYREYTALNTDDRKIQDGLRMTLSLSVSQADVLEGDLETKRRAGLIRYGLAKQDSAVLTCFVPSVTSDSHFHFLDGAGGGYAEAATRMLGP